MVRLCCQVAELVVDNCRSTDGEVEGLTEDYAELEVLSMVNVGLTSLSKLPPLPKLRKVGSSRGPTRPDLGTGADRCVTCVPAGGERQRHLGGVGLAG